MFLAFTIHTQRSASSDTNRNASSGLLSPPLFPPNSKRACDRGFGVGVFGSANRIDLTFWSHVCIFGCCVGNVRAECWDGFVRNKTNLSEIKGEQLQEGTEAFRPFASKK